MRRLLALTIVLCLIVPGAIASGLLVEGWQDAPLEQLVEASLQLAERMKELTGQLAPAQERWAMGFDISVADFFAAYNTRSREEGTHDSRLDFVLVENGEFRDTYRAQPSDNLEVFLVGENTTGKVVMLMLQIKGIETAAFGDFFLAADASGRVLKRAATVLLPDGAPEDFDLIQTISDNMFESPDLSGLNEYPRGDLTYSLNYSGDFLYVLLRRTQQYDSKEAFLEYYQSTNSSSQEGAK